MTPLNSQPSQEYPIRALVRADGHGIAWNRDGKMSAYKGQVIMVRHYLGNLYLGPKGDNKGDGWCWGAIDDIIIDPTPAQVAEERAKAGLPAETREAPPEASEGVPSLPSPSEASEGAPPPAPSVPMGGGVEALREAAEHLAWAAEVEIQGGHRTRSFINQHRAKVTFWIKSVREALAKLEGR